MKFVSIILLALLTFLNPFAQDINDIIKEGDRLEAVPNETSAFLKFKEAVLLQPGNIYAVVKCSELCSRIGKRQSDKKVREDFYAAAKAFAELALKINPNNSDANFVMAMALGHISLNKSTKE